MNADSIAKAALAGLLIYSCSAAGEIVYVKVTADIVDINDPSGVVSDIQAGDAIEGFYIYDTDTADQNSDIGLGEYQQELGVGTIELNIGTYTFKTTTDTSGPIPITIDINDEYMGDSSESYEVISYSNELTKNSIIQNATIHDIYIVLYDSNGKDILSSDALTDTPPNPMMFTDRDVWISGKTDGDSFNILANISSLGAIDQASPLKIVPGDALIHPEQRFDAVFNVDITTPITAISGRLNGMDISSYLEGCMMSAPHEDVQSVLCPDTHWLLEPGDNHLYIQMDLEDATSIRNDVTWTLPL
jgi:hypothetical protein